MPKTALNVDTRFCSISAAAAAAAAAADAFAPAAPASAIVARAGVVVVTVAGAVDVIVADVVVDIDVVVVVVALVVDCDVVVVVVVCVLDVPVFEVVVVDAVVVLVALLVVVEVRLVVVLLRVVLLVVMVVVLVAVAVDVVEVAVVVVRVVVDVAVVVVHNPSANDSSVPSQPAQALSVVALAGIWTYWPGKHTVNGEHSRSVSPGAGGRDSHSSAPHAVEALQTTFCTADAATATASCSAHVLCMEHSGSVCASSFLYCPSGHAVHRFVAAERNSPRGQIRAVVVVDVAVVVLETVVVVTVAVVEVCVAVVVDVRVAVVVVAVVVVLDVTDVVVVTDVLVIVVDVLDAVNVVVDSVLLVVVLVKVVVVDVAVVVVLVVKEVEVRVTVVEVLVVVIDVVGGAHCHPMQRPPLSRHPEHPTRGRHVFCGHVLYLWLKPQSVQIRAANPDQRTGKVNRVSCLFTQASMIGPPPYTLARSLSIHTGCAYRRTPLERGGQTAKTNASRQRIVDRMHRAGGFRWNPHNRTF